MDVVIKFAGFKHNSKWRGCVLCGLVWDITKRKSYCVQSPLAVCGPTFRLHCMSSLEVSKALYYISNWTTLEKSRDVVVAAESSLRPPSVLFPPMVETRASSQKGGRQSFCFAAVSFSALQTLWAFTGHATQCTVALHAQERNVDICPFWFLRWLGLLKGSQNG